MDRCYNCGSILIDSNKTREHIPARNLYNGFPIEFKKDLITVPACLSCNQQYSKIDQIIRDAIGIMNEDDEKQNELTRQSVKSILRNSNWESRIERNSNGDVIAINFSYDELKDLHIKNFKGLIYKLYGIPLPDRFKIEIVTDGDEVFENILGTAKYMYDYVDSFNDWNESGHKDVFMFSIKTLAQDLDQQLVDSGDINNCLAVIGVLVYHKKLCAVIVAAEIDFLEQCRPS